MHVLGFEGYDAGSHHAVRASITRHSRHEWTWVTRPGRDWKWRMRVGGLELVEQARRENAFTRPADTLFITSMVNAADVLAALPRRWRDRPAIVYMHENQAAYPAGERGPDPRDVHFALTNLASVRVADLVIWNSAWNRRSFAAGIRAIMRHARDADGSLVEGLEEIGTVIWPPVEPPPPDLGVLHNREAGRTIDGAGAGGAGTRVVWPHRWEYDKGPDELLAIAGVETERLNLRWILLGQQFGQTPPALARFRAEHESAIVHAGYAADRLAYWRWLASADWVLSTARHEFFGIAVVEALLAGCLPWLPARLSYEEILPSIAWGLGPGASPDDPDAVRRAVAAHLQPAVAPNAVGHLDDAIEAVVNAT
ncbi:MAG: DUF3524 domain-containing protein [Phycisphaerales bacterium]|nr:DUF3524 domain-containing protein [Phycisphaerae bacterium]NNF42701.1 DUF3524 domain-containing protein [Phycisphaerales bacterium]NNM27183.1 DUF3524 domain-containing protein [Phycisphaerales bacterium]